MARTSLLLLILAAFWHGPVAGQEATVPAPGEQTQEGQPTEQPPEEEQLPPLVVTGNELLARLDEGMARVGKLEEQAAAAEGEDRRILERQVIDVKVDLLDTFHRLVKNLVAQEQEGLPTGELRTRVEAGLRKLPGAFTAHIDATAAEIAEIRKERDEAPPADKLSLEHRIARRVDWLNMLFKSYAELIGDMEAVGLDAAAPRADVTERTKERADRLAGRLQLVGDQLKRAKQLAVDDPDDPAIKAEIQLLEEQRNSMSQAISDTAGILDRLGLDSSAYRKTLIKSTGEVTTDVFRTDVFKGLVADWWEELKDWLDTHGRAFLFRLIVFCLILVVSRVIAAIVKALLKRTFRRSAETKSTLLKQMVDGLIVRTIMILGLLFGLSALGLQLGPILAGLGIAGFIVGFALQDSLSNFAAGVMILVYRPFDMGDMIEAGGVFGRVDKMSLVSTTILTIDNQTLIVPNSKIWGDVIKNVTNQKVRRIDLTFLISHSEDLERIERLFTSVLEGHPKILEDPAPMVKLHALGEYAMEFVVRPWVQTADYWEVRWDLMREIKRRLDEQGIEVPVPGREVRLTRS